MYVLWKRLLYVSALVLSVCQAMWVCCTRPTLLYCCTTRTRYSCLQASPLRALPYALAFPVLITRLHGLCRAVACSQGVYSFARRVFFRRR